MSNLESCAKKFLQRNPSLCIFSAQEAQDSYLIGVRPKGVTLFESFDSAYYLLSKKDGSYYNVHPVENAEIFEKTKNVKNLIPLDKPMHL